MPFYYFQPFDSWVHLNFPQVRPDAISSLMIVRLAADLA